MSTPNPPTNQELDDRLKRVEGQMRDWRKIKFGILLATVIALGGTAAWTIYTIKDQSLYPLASVAIYAIFAIALVAALFIFLKVLTHDE